MSDQSGSSRLRVLFENALKAYKQQTGIELPKHAIAERLQDCGSVEDVAAVLREQAQEFKEFREKSDNIMKPIKQVLTVLHKLSSVAGLGHDVGLVCPKALAGRSVSLTLSHRISLLSKRYRLALVSYSLYIPFFSNSACIFVISKHISRSRASLAITTLWPICSIQLDTSSVASRSIPRFNLRML